MNQSDRLDVTFAALTDPTRRAILARLALGETSVSELARPFAMSQPAISKHLKVLERAGLISSGQTRSDDRAASKRRRWPKRMAGSRTTASSGRRATSASMRCWTS
jgi:DNA-binding transcriptional ArsR family regulator